MPDGDALVDIAGGLLKAISDRDQLAFWPHALKDMLALRKARADIPEAVGGWGCNFYNNEARGNFRKTAKLPGDTPVTTA